MHPVKSPSPTTHPFVDQRFVECLLWYVYYSQCLGHISK